MRARTHVMEESRGIAVLRPSRATEEQIKILTLKLLIFLFVLEFLLKHIYVSMFVAGNGRISAHTETIPMYLLLTQLYIAQQLSAVNRHNIISLAKQPTVESDQKWSYLRAEFCMMLSGLSLSLALSPLSPLSACLAAGALFS